MSWATVSKIFEPSKQKLILFLVVTFLMYFGYVWVQTTNLVLGWGNNPNVTWAAMFVQAPGVVLSGKFYVLALTSHVINTSIPGILTLCLLEATFVTFGFAYYYVVACLLLILIEFARTHLMIK